MLTTLQTSYTDTRAGDLAWQLGGEPLPALAVRDLRLDGACGAPDGLRGTLQLRLLGASHQVVLAAGPGDCLETVACLPGRRTPLPARVAEQVAGWEYEFAARIEELPPHVFAARAQELLALVEGHPRALAGVFPGDPSAFTALVAHCEDRRVHWRTWHAYPQEGRLVCTRSSLSLPGTGRPETSRAADGAAASAAATAAAAPAQVGW
ncbi:DUF2617 family protein [Kitasatospora phosalacinea]|uniref:DUF2617 domain-containing protein n=1 Tax=Kitasatospora phosalacinea TaxID=2065 RepID=A0A9W6PEC3_9ACTN|nr:DUF2617 family protein [Kitasatospora phosalacinea]GLW53393.1 hypothetical protein Kpho01_14040 [Kitasatospora phosalacinea]